ncbi:MAG: serine protease [Deltaproteobacteria bacterium]|nr:MAG: serine protease [Deltaproteobacteria bacterium]
MNSRQRRGLWPIVGGAWAAVFVTAASAQEFRSVPPEPAVRGVTVAEHFVRQQQLNTWLTREMPHGTLATRVGIKLTRDERSDLQKRVPAGGAPLRIGTVKSLTPAVSVSGLVPQAQNQGVSQVAGGRFQTTDDGGFVWALAIGSEGANGIRVHLKNFSLPANADMYFFNLEGEAHGPYQGRGRNGDGDFWTNTVFSETAVILLRQFGPATQQDQRNLAFVIDRVGHIGGGFPVSGPQGHLFSHDQCGNASCVLDASCGGLGPAAPAADAVAKIEWVQGRFIFTCSGGLIADTDGSAQRNLFLTANHCISKKRNASNMETFFFYTTSSCNGNCLASPPTSTIGSTILRTSQNGDFTLLELSENPPSGTMFLGFNNSLIAFTGGAELYRISNPNFGPQVFSHHQVDLNKPTCGTLPRGEFIYSVDVEGATDGGSSGAPVVNSAGEIVGQLFGCCGFNCSNVCNKGANATVDGALAFYYDQVEEFLDPSPCTPSTEVCDNGIDDDCDSFVDCDDADCNGDPACEVSGCTGLGNKEPCNENSECCSGKCRKGTCRGN